MVLPSHLIQHIVMPSDEDYKTSRSISSAKVAKLYHRDKCHTSAQAPYNTSKNLNINTRDIIEMPARR